MKTIIYGFGQMGQKIYQQLKAQNESIVAVVSQAFDYSIDDLMLADLRGFEQEADVLIDFSHPDNLQDILDYALRTKTKLVLATTGYTKQQLDLIEEASQEIAIFQSYNMSFGISMLVKILKDAVKDFYGADFDIEILEKHHHRKIDAPSGTAKLLYQVMEDELPELKPVYDRSELHQKREKEEVGMQAIRGGTIFGEHSVYFAGLDEIVEIKHTALSRDVFKTGAIQAARILLTKEKGLYNLKNLY